MKNLKIIKKHLENSVSKIDDILNDQKKFAEYITEIQNKDIYVPEDILQNTKAKLLNITEENTIKKNQENTEENTEEKDKNRYKYKIFEITKVAVCALLTILIWNSKLYQNVSHIDSFDVKQSKIYINIDNKLKNISGFLLNPIIKE